MKQKSSAPFFRVLLIFLVIFVITEYLYKTGNDPAFVSNPSVVLFLIIVLTTLIAIEGIKSGDRSLEKTIEEELNLPEETKSTTQVLWKNMLKKLTKTKPITEEETILLDHNYDGIKELDNALPPWWLYSFYASIVFAVLYLGYYEILGGNTNVQNFEEEMEIARLNVEQYKRDNPSTFDATKISSVSDTDAGQKIFKSNCAVCHAVDGGGGIGPNLTDDYWILGGGIKNIYNTISEGGRDGKGMIAWKNSLNAEKRQQVASYILSLQGTTPKKPKEKQGDLWTGEK
jgi:cytochrome c oxidase cbb3-type subunit 3